MKGKKANKKGKKSIALIIVISFAVVFHIVNSSLYAKDKFYWLNAGLGLSTFKGYSESQNGDFVPSGGISFSCQTGRSVFSIRYIHSREAEIEGIGFSPTESLWDAGILYGISSRTSRSLASVSGGISIVGGVRRGELIKSGWLEREYEKISVSTIGLPIEVQLFWTPTSILGIGVYGFVNVNKEKSFAGALLCVQIGKLREK